jgi:hypothetical protein
MQPQVRNIVRAKMAMARVESLSDAGGAAFRGKRYACRRCIRPERPRRCLPLAEQGFG